ncbi:MAG: ATP-binding protein [Bacteroidales bacterium]|nr:ATP-binding protein [Bacteroidales bacterium]
MCIEISDNGPGFSDKANEHLFDLFSADNLNHQYFGFGIGLATAKIILDLLSARMEVTNLSDGGAKVILIFNEPALN